MGNRSIGGGTKFISGLFEISNKLKISSYLVTIDIEKAFDELDHDLEHESFVIKGEAITQYFRLQRYSRPGDSIPAYLFMLYLQILFVLLKTIKILKA